jgi:hypothetical protein
MSRGGRPSLAKRLREQARDQKARDKAQRRQEKSSRPANSPDDGVDPDIAGIVPGPQAQPWMEDPSGGGGAGTGGERPDED